MNEYEKELLKLAYDALGVDDGRVHIQIRDDSCNMMDPEDLQKLETTLHQLEAIGYIEIHKTYINEKSFGITPRGRLYMDGKLLEDQPPIVIQQGAQNINIAGSNNLISSNFNQLLIDLRSDGISEEIIKLLESLSVDLQKSGLSKATKIDRVKDFLLKLAGESVSASALKVLTTLLASHFGV